MPGDDRDLYQHPRQLEQKANGDEGGSQTLKSLAYPVPFEYISASFISRFIGAPYRQRFVAKREDIQHYCTKKAETKANTIKRYYHCSNPLSALNRYAHARITGLQVLAIVACNDRTIELKPFSNVRVVPQVIYRSLSIVSMKKSKGAPDPSTLAIAQAYWELAKESW